MAVQVDRFVIKENTFDGLNQAAENLRQDKYRNQQLESQQYERQQQQEAKKLSTAKFLESYYDPKDYLSGTVYDPEVTKQILDLKSEAQKMVTNGVSDPNMITAALAPKASRLAEYSQKAKYINENLNKRLQDIPANSGYIKDKLRQESLRGAFYGPDGKLKDITTIDPDIDWMAEAVRKNPLAVTDNTGLQEYITKTSKNTELIDAKTYNSKGGFARKKLKVTAPGFMQLDKDERGNDTRDLVPKFELAADDENPITHEFVGKDGKKVVAPVRLVDENVFKQILASNPSYADNLRGQVMGVLEQYKNPDGSTIDINSPQATNVARALLYDDLKALRPGTVEDFVETKPNQIRLYNSSGGRPSKAEVLAGTPLDFSEYKKVGDGYDITELAPGINVTGLPDGKKLAATQIVYNPDTKKVTYTDVMGNTKTQNFETFRQNIATINTGVDLSFIDRLKVTGRPGQSNVPKTTAKMVTMVLPDGRKGQIPEDKVDQFLKDNPKAKKQ